MDCRFCGEPAGFFRRQHAGCAAQHGEAKQAAEEAVARAAADGRSWADIETAVREELSGGLVPEESLPSLVSRGLEAVERQVFSASDPDEEKERRLLGFIGSLDPADLGGATARRIGQRIGGPALVRQVRDAACGGRRFQDVESAIRKTLRHAFLPEERLEALLGEGLEAAEEKVLDDDVLDEDEERAVLGFIESVEDAGLAGDTVDAVRERLGSASAVRSVLEGNNPWRPERGISLQGFRLMKSEAPIWGFEPVGYEIMKTRVHYTGGSRGVGFRVAKGVYVRTGSFRGERHTVEERHLVDRGRLLVTTKHVYYSGTSHRFRIRHDRVVSYEPLSDGFEVTRDRANAKPERFYGMDGWFIYNLLMNAEDLA